MSELKFCSGQLHIIFQFNMQNNEFDLGYNINIHIH